MKNRNYAYYSREQIIYYILIDMFKPILPLGKVKVLFAEMLSPIIEDVGLDAAFGRICEIIAYMTGRFEDAVSMAFAEEKLIIARHNLEIEGKALSEKALQDIGQYTNLTALCMARSALDFYKFSPYALLG